MYIGILEDSMHSSKILFCEIHRLFINFYSLSLPLSLSLSFSLTFSLFVSELNCLIRHCRLLCFLNSYIVIIEEVLTHYKIIIFYLLINYLSYLIKIYRFCACLFKVIPVWLYISFVKNHNRFDDTTCKDYSACIHKALPFECSAST